MPYIKQDQRNVLDPHIDHLIAQLCHSIPADKRPGAINYSVCRIVCNALRPNDGWSYHSLSKALAVLHDAEAELRRRLMDKHEDIVIQNNGDLKEFFE